MPRAELPTRLSFQDAAFLSFERDSMPMNVGSVGIYDHPIDFAEFVQHVDRRIDLVPRYRQRVLPVPFELGPPRWADDPAFDIHNHVRHASLRPPGTRAQLAELAGRFFAQRLPRDRPLWEMLLVDNVEGGSAHIARVHHCMVDGVSGVGLLAALLDFEPRPHRPQPPRRRAPKRVPGAAELVAGAALDRIDDDLRLGERMLLASLDPVGTLRKAGRMARALEVSTEYLAVPAEHAPWNMRLHGPTRLAWHRIPFAETRAVARALGGTINDVALTTIAGALSRWSARDGRRVDHLRMRAAAPVNVRAEHEDGMLGNRVSFMLVGLPLGERDPVRRFRAVHAETSELKAAGQASGIDELFDLVGALPPATQALVGRTLTLPNTVSNLICTNVPGPLVPLYLMGHRMVDHYPWVPLGWRMGLSVAIMSYDSGLYFSFSLDERAPEGMERVAGDLADAFEELRAAAGVTPEPIEAPVPAPPYLLKRPPAEVRPKAAPPTRAAAAASRRSQ